MACSIQITSVTASTTGGAVTSIRVAGTATECTEVAVEVECLAGTAAPILTGSAPVNATGDWEVLLNDLALLQRQECLCGEHVGVKAYCVQDPTCAAIPWPSDAVLECPPSQPTVCPIITSSAFNAGPCKPDGSRDFTFTVDLDSPDPYTVEIRVTGGALLGSVSGPGPQTLTVNGAYSSAITFNFVVSPAHCSLPSSTQGFTSCTPCPMRTENSPIFGECDAAGNRSVTVSYTLVSAGGYDAVLSSAAGAPLATVSGPGSQTLTHTETYPAGSSQTFTVTVTSPGECGATTYQVDVPRCACPDITWNAPAFSDCVDGRRDVTVSATLNAASVYTAELHDASGAVLSTVLGSGVQTLRATTNVSGGSSFVCTVVVTAPPGCGGSTSPPIEVPVCPESVCPQVTIDPVGALACNPDGTVTVAVNAVVTPSVLPTKVHWEYDGGSADPQTTINSSTPTNVAGTHNYLGDGGTHSATLLIDEPTGMCDPSTIPFVVPQCPPIVPPPESTGCSALRIAVAVLAALGFLFAMLAGCLVNEYLYYVSGSLLTTATALLVVYAIFCPNKPCNWGLLLAGQILIGTGVAAMILSQCCPWMLWAGLASIVVGAGVLTLWSQLCNVSACRVAKEITAVVGGVTLPILGIVNNIFPGCVDVQVQSIIGAVFGPIAAFAAMCRD